VNSSFSGWSLPLNLNYNLSGTSKFTICISPGVINLSWIIPGSKISSKRFSAGTSSFRESESESSSGNMFLRFAVWL